MADLDFSRSVPDVPASSGPNVPAPYHRTETVQPVRMPDFQQAMTNYAADTNWMSFIGSQVAAKASDAVAQKIGGELGKNPKGDIGPSFTDFDKTMKNSYNQQAQATLSLQANKLLTDSNIATAQATRITPDLIAKTNASVTKGMQDILKNAPDEVKPHMELQFGTAMLDQNAQLSGRMIREQKEDQRNNSALASDLNSQHAYSFGLNGNEKAGLAAIENTRRLNEASYAARLITPEDVKSRVDSARQSYLSGKMIHDYNNAKDKEGYLKSIADKKPSYLSDTDYMAVTNNLMQYVNHQDSLRSQDQQLRVAKFNNSIAMNPMAPDMASQLQDLKNNVSPETYEKAQLSYINAVKTYNKESGDVNNALASWNDPSSFARLTEKSVNKGYDMLVNRYIQQRDQQGSPISHEEAEAQVAASAAGKVPVFVDTLKNKLNSANPAMMDVAARQIDSLYSMNAGHALQGLSDSDKSIYTQFKSLRDSLPPEEAAKIAIQNANQDPDTQKMNKEKWSAFVKSQTAGTIFGATAPTKWALKQVGLNEDEFLNPGIANEYGNLILQKYATFYQNLNGDKDNALKMIKQEVKENFGTTGVNGGSVKTLHPLEKVLGYDENSDVVPYIQNDVMDTLHKSFAPTKEAFSKNQSNVYWDIVPSDQKNRNYIYGHNYPPIQVKRYMKTASGVKTDTYDVMLIGNSFNWDIALKTDSGMRPLIQVAPYLGVQTYTPNKKAIDAAYTKRVRGK
jgi:hypothetical protein